MPESHRAGHLLLPPVMGITCHGFPAAGKILQEGKVLAWRQGESGLIHRVIAGVAPGEGGRTGEAEGPGE